MAAEPKAMKSIWYVVGTMMLIMGALVLIAGIINLINPPAQKTVLAEIHPELWWGVLIFVFGGVLFLSHRKG